MPKQLNNSVYESEFDGSRVDSDSRHTRALEHALDIRKFEIDLYWKRSAYFWTFIGAALAAYGATLSDATEKEHLSVLVLSSGSDQAKSLKFSVISNQKAVF